MVSDTDTGQKEEAWGSALPATPQVASGASTAPSSGALVFEQSTTESGVSEEHQETHRTFWLENGAALSLGELERIQRTVLHAASLLREGAMEEAKRCIGVSLEAFERFLVSVHATEKAHRFESSSPLEERLRALLARVKEESAASLWAPLADRIEYELLPNLHDWSRRLRTWSEAQISRWAA